MTTLQDFMFQLKWLQILGINEKTDLWLFQDNSVQFSDIK